MTDRGFRNKLAGTSLALVMLCACSQEPAGTSAGTEPKTSESAQEQRAAARADCRDEVAAAFERLRTSGRPYREETTVTTDRGTSDETAEFVPPDQMRLSHDSGWIVHEYYIRIGHRAWANWSPFPWGWSEEYPDPRFMQMHTASNEFTVMPNVPPLVYECLGRVDFEGMAYVGYRARHKNAIMVMVPHNGALSETRERELDRKLDQMPQEWRTVFVAPQSALPAYELVAQENRLGNPSLKVRYTYPQDIDIEPPLWCRLGLCRSVSR